MAVLADEGTVVTAAGAAPVEVADDNDEVELCVGCEDDEDENTENLANLSGAGASKVLPLGLLQSTLPLESFPQHRHRPVVELYTTSGCGWSPTIRGQSWLVLDHSAFFSEIRTSTVGGTYCRPWSIRRHLSVFDSCNLRHSNLTCLSPAEREMADVVGETFIILDAAGQSDVGIVPHRGAREMLPGCEVQVL